MLLTTALLLLVLGGSHAFIIGGADGDIEEVPWLLSLHYTGRHSCGAALVEQKWAVTAAHCVDGRTMENFEVKAGMESQDEDSSLHQTLSVVGITIHPDYRYALGYPNDVAVLELSPEASYNDRVNFIVLAQGSSLWNYAPCKLPGWGTTEHVSEGIDTNRFQLGHGFVMTSGQCLQDMSEITMLDNSYVCTEGDAAICNGDDGGPVTCLDEDSSNSPLSLVGVMSWSINAGGFCIQTLPSVHARISHYHSWIESITGELPDKFP